LKNPNKIYAGSIFLCSRPNRLAANPNRAFGNAIVTLLHPIRVGSHGISFILVPMAEAQGRMCHRMLYLALPPSVFMPVTTNIRAALMDTEGIWHTWVLALPLRVLKNSNYSSFSTTKSFKMRAENDHLCPANP
jgi:hypothetical protein